jgi:hypothetical protein
MIYYVALHFTPYEGAVLIAGQALEGPSEAVAIGRAEGPRV